MTTTNHIALAFALTLVAASAQAKKKTAAPDTPAPVAATPPPAPAPAPPPPPPSPPPAADAVAPPPTVAADDALRASPAATEKHDRGAVLLGLKAGGLFPEAFSPLGPSFLVDVEAGYVMPWLRRSFAVILDVGFTMPTASGTQTDPRVDVSGNGYSWDLTQRELVFGLTAMYRVPYLLDGRLGPYVGIGPRLWLLQTKVVGQAGAGNNINESTEQSTKVGLSVPIGLDYALGPGRLFGEVQILWAPIDHRITGDSSVGSFTVDVGYRLLL
jgi:opacity protein-like surface antigen